MYAANRRSLSAASLSFTMTPSAMMAFPFSIIKKSFLSHGRSTPPLPESFQKLILLSVRLLSDSVVLGRLPRQHREAALRRPGPWFSKVEIGLLVPVLKAFVP